MYIHMWRGQRGLVTTVEQDRHMYIHEYVQIYPFACCILPIDCPLSVYVSRVRTIYTWYLVLVPKCTGLFELQLLAISNATYHLFKLRISAIEYAT